MDPCLLMMVLDQLFYVFGNCYTHLFVQIQHLLYHLSDRVHVLCPSIHDLCLVAQFMASYSLPYSDHYLLQMVFVEPTSWP